jgi:repressor LexA
MGKTGSVGRSSDRKEPTQLPQKSAGKAPHRRRSNDLRADILHAIETYLREHGCPPTIREIGSAVGVASSSHVSYYVSQLEQEGLLSRAPGRSRGLLPTRPAGMRVLGTIAAGDPLELFDSGESEVLQLDELGNAATSVRTPPDREMFALRVRGTSMIDDGILDGDYVLITPGLTVANGAIGVAIHNTANGGRGAATLKRIFIRSDAVQLQPANTELSPRYITSEEWAREWSVQGTVMAVYRRYAQRPLL